MTDYGIEEIDIRRCPLCGKDCAIGHVDYHQKTVDEQGWPQERFYFVNCCWCGCSNKGIRGYETPEKAVENWNRRSYTLPVHERRAWNR